MHLQIKRLSLALLLATSAAYASAGVVVINDRSSFEALGHIAFNSNFADFASTEYTTFSAPFSRGDVTYQRSNMIVGKNAGLPIGATQNVLANQSWNSTYGTTVLATIATKAPYSLFGFDADIVQGTANIAVTTNFGTYHFDNLALANGKPQFTFEGFRTTSAGEYFTGFTLNSMSYSGLTNVAVGTVSAVPEPESCAMLAIGLVVLAGMRRRAGFIKVPKADLL